MKRFYHITFSVFIYNSINCYILTNQAILQMLLDKRVEMSRLYHFDEISIKGEADAFTIDKDSSTTIELTGSNIAKPKNYAASRMAYSLQIFQEQKPDYHKEMMRSI